jgi:F-type H+-transporting ATPase subunit delta
MPVAKLGRYARSLAEVAFEQNIEDKVVKDLRLFSGIFSRYPEMCKVFESLAIPRDEKEKLLDALLTEHPVTPIASNFMRVLLERNRMHLFQRIFGLFIEIVNKRHGVVSAKIVTASPLDSDGIVRIEKRLGNITGKTVIAAAVETDENLLGGMVVSVGNTVYDGSVRTQLDEMRRRLTGQAVV